VAQKGGSVGAVAGCEAEGGEEERGEETRVTVAAAGEEEGVRLEELPRGGDAREEGEHAVERKGQRRLRRRHAGVGGVALAPPLWPAGCWSLCGCGAGFREFYGG
jgi:hypothetical protein